ncbi:unnamed protein product [Ranitomeya imitator]|uniref:Uncharacterized protein n=1 Tax=Ranitomeya imitator TaxID=111125 RepID=A0ABN9LNB1_9NEOB|nr:unnamed protein product [Ranitomeya imitator]
MAVQKSKAVSLSVLIPAGLTAPKTVLKTRMAEQSLLAIEEADVVLFMVDARAGLMPADTAIAKHLRSREIHPIAASHGRGVTSLLEHVLVPFMDDIDPKEEIDEEEAFWADFNAKNGL